MLKSMRRLVLSASVLFLATWSTAAFAAEVNLKLGHVGPPTHPYNTGAIRLADLAAEYSNNEIKIDVFPASQIGNERDLLEGAQLGTVDMLLTASGPVMEIDKSFGVLDLPYIFRDTANAHAILDGAIGDQLFAKLENHGLVGLSWFENGTRDVINSKRPINTPKDFNGLTIRSLENPIHIAFFKKLNANPIPMAFSEVYLALDKKVVDGADNPPAAIRDAKLYEVNKNLAMTQHIYSAVPVLISKKAFDKLTDSQKEALRRAAKEAATYERELLSTQDTDVVDDLKSKGMEVTYPNKEVFEEIGRAVQDDFAEKTDPELIKAIRAAQ